MPVLGEGVAEHGEVDARVGVDGDDVLDAAREVVGDVVALGEAPDEVVLDTGLGLDVVHVLVTCELVVGDAQLGEEAERAEVELEVVLEVEGEAGVGGGADVLGRAEAEERALVVGEELHEVARGEGVLLARGATAELVGDGALEVLVAGVVELVVALHVLEREDVARDELDAGRVVGERGLLVVAAREVDGRRLGRLGGRASLGVSLGVAGLGVGTRLALRAGHELALGADGCARVLVRVAVGRVLRAPGAGAGARELPELVPRLLVHVGGIGTPVVAEGGDLGGERGDLALLAGSSQWRHWEGTGRHGQARAGTGRHGRHGKAREGTEGTGRH